MKYYSRFEEGSTPLLVFFPFPFVSPLLSLLCSYKSKARRAAS